MFSRRVEDAMRSSANSKIDSSFRDYEYIEKHLKQTNWNFPLNINLEYKREIPLQRLGDVEKDCEQLPIWRGICRCKVLHKIPSVPKTLICWIFVYGSYCILIAINNVCTSIRILFETSTISACTTWYRILLRSNFSKFISWLITSKYHEAKVDHK